MDKHFEQQFSNYIDSEQHEQVSEAIFRLIRQAFIAGWQAGKTVGVQSESPETLENS